MTWMTDCVSCDRVAFKPHFYLKTLNSVGRAVPLNAQMNVAVTVRTTRTYILAREGRVKKGTQFTFKLKYIQAETLSSVLAGLRILQMAMLYIPEKQGFVVGYCLKLQY